MTTRGIYRLIHAALVLCWLLLAGPLSHAADPQLDPATLQKVFAGTVARVIRANADAHKLPATATQDEKLNAQLNIQAALTRDLIPFVQAWASPSAFRSLLSDLEQQRLDKAVGTTSGTSGGTSPVSKGSVPSILGFAVEQGGLTESVNNTVITFQANLANLVKAMSQQDYLSSWIDPNDAWITKTLQHATASVSFDASQGGSNGVFTGSTRQLSGASAHFDIYNKRDPRHPDYRAAWNRLMAEEGARAAAALNALAVKLTTYQGRQPFSDWSTKAGAAVAGAPDADVEARVLEQAQSFMDAFGKAGDLQPAFKDASDALTAYAKSRRDEIGAIAKSPILSAEYNFTRQFPQAQSLNAMASMPGTSVTSNNGGTLPDLSNITLIYTTSFGKSSQAAELTSNFAVTFFQSLPKGSTAGSLRDARFSLQLDVPLREIKGIGTPQLSASYLFLDLLEKPLGAAVTINGTQIGATGPIHLGQAKLSIPVKDSGMKIPISFTITNRTELNTEKKKDVRGTIGITYDFDSLFSKPKSGN
jgi:hypothetical protein